MGQPCEGFRLVHSQEGNFRKMLKQIFGSILSGIILACLFFISNDIWFGIPNLDGKWNVHCDYTGGKYKDMKADFIALVQLSGQNVQGSMEKKSETSAGGIVTKYKVEKRNQASFTGYITKKYSTNDRMSVHIDEQGSLMTIKEVEILEVLNDKLIRGTFATTRGEHSGTVTWTRQ
jgi:hypothetical protein